MLKCARGASTHGDVLNVHTGTFGRTHGGEEMYTPLCRTTSPAPKHTHTHTRPIGGTSLHKRPIETPIGIGQNLLKTYLVGILRNCGAPLQKTVLPGCKHRLRNRSADLSAGQSEFPERKIRATRKPRNDDTCVEFFDLANSEKECRSRLGLRRKIMISPGDQLGPAPGMRTAEQQSA